LTITGAIGAKSRIGVRATPEMDIIPYADQNPPSGVYVLSDFQFDTSWFLELTSENPSGS
jgi:hypothetical protein